MDYLLIISFITAVCGAPQTKFKTQIRQYALSDLDTFNCNNPVDIGSCSSGCAMSECYATSTTSGATFPQDGFCTVFNVSQPISNVVDWYTVSGRICLSSANYPQGTGLLFNCQDYTNYEVVYKISQTSSTCYVGYVQNGVVQETGSFDCGITTADQWHRYTVTVYSDKTFEVTLSSQSGSSTTSGRFPSNYPMFTRGGVMIVNDGSPGKVLRFDEITARLSTDIDDCASSPCGPGGSCVDGTGSYTCNCYPGYAGVRCETNIDECASSPCGPGGTCVDGSGSYTCSCSPGYTGVRCETDGLLAAIYFLESESGSGGYISSLTPDGVQTRVADSGSDTEHALAIDSQADLLFYSTHGTGSTKNPIWIANLRNVAVTNRVLIDMAQDVNGMTVCTRDRLIFPDQKGDGIAMVSYDGALVDTLSVGKGNSISLGLAVDEANRILYFTDVGGRIWNARFSPTGFNGSATAILQGNGDGEAGEQPAGLVLEGDTLYWILEDTGEIRFMSVTGSTSTVLVTQAGSSGYNSEYLTKKNEYFYYTRQVSDGGVWRVAAGGTREKITTSTTLATQGIDVY